MNVITRVNNQCTVGIDAASDHIDILRAVNIYTIRSDGATQVVHILSIQINDLPAGDRTAIV